ncbi:MAG: insulinase family protein [Candidatus Azambacteria bacterium]|nr:insulinase family protein [Candidatus Azambacteria bacterium]
MKNKLTYHKTTLANGIQVITVPMKNTSTVSSIVFVKTGSRHEHQKESGISHVLEHMLFQGTKKRPDKTTLKRELDRIGAQSNAGTSQDYTMYYIKADAKHLELSLDILSDMYCNPLFRKEALEKERRVVVEEIHMYTDTPQRQVWDNFYHLLHPNNSLGRSIAGPIKTVLALKQKDLFSYLTRAYVAKNTVIVIAGNINERRAIEKVKKHFKGVRKGKASVCEPAISLQKDARTHVAYKKIDQAHLVVGTVAYSALDKRRYALDVLVAILGGYSSSRLVVSVRDNLGLAYYVGADASYHEDTGALCAYAGINLSNIDLGITAIMKEFKKAKTKLIPQKEIDDAKSHIEGAFSLRLEASDSVAVGAGWSELMTKSIETPEEYVKNIKKVSAIDVREVAKDIFKTEKLNFAIIGPFREKDKKRFHSLLHI